MKKLFLALVTLITVLYFMPAEGSKYYYYPPLKGFDTLETTVGEYVYTTNEIHTWFNDLNSSFSVAYPGLWEYDFSGRNFATDTLFIDFYEIDFWRSVVSIDIDTVWSYTETDTSFVVYSDTTWQNHYDIDVNTIDSTVLYGFNRTISGLRFYIDTLGNQNMKWRMKDTPSRVFEQVNKNG
jgi:hypothetical protein